MSLASRLRDHVKTLVPASFELHPLVNALETFTGKVDELTGPHGTGYHRLRPQLVIDEARQGFESARLDAVRREGNGDPDAADLRIAAETALEGLQMIVPEIQRIRHA